MRLFCFITIYFVCAEANAQKLKLGHPTGHSGRLNSAVLSPDRKRIEQFPMTKPPKHGMLNRVSLTVSENETSKVWEVF